MELGYRIRALRINNEMTQREVGNRLGVSEVSIRCWENGTKSPSMNAIISLSELFHVSTDYLLGVSSDEDKDSRLLNHREIKLLTNYRVLDSHGKKAVDTICLLEKDRVEGESDHRRTSAESAIPTTSVVPNRYIPRFISPSAAGYSTPLVGNDFEMILVDDNVPANADFAVGIQGNSMYPYIKDGDTVYIKKDCELSIGDVGIFYVDGSMYCKQYYVDDQRNLTLVSANPEFRHTNIYIGADSGSDVKCYGKVILEDSIELPDYLFE